MPNPFLGGILTIAISAIILAQLFMTTIHNTNTSTWTAAEVSMWGVLGLVGVVGLLYGTLNVFGVV
jgi:hypothetical protein